MVASKIMKSTKLFKAFKSLLYICSYIVVLLSVDVLVHMVTDNHQLANDSPG